MTRIGLTQRVVEVPEYGERRDCLDQAWTPLLEELGYDPVVLPNRVTDVSDYLASMELDGVILTSGNDLATLEEPADPAPERDRFERSLLDFAIDSSLPILGVCRGFELLNDYFGGQLVPVESHVAKEHQVEFTTPPGPDFLPTEAPVNSYHDYGIEADGLAKELLPFAHAPDGTIEGVVHEEHPFVGIMWHPERDSPVSELDQQLITHTFGGRLP